MEGAERSSGSLWMTGHFHLGTSAASWKSIGFSSSETNLLYRVYVTSTLWDPSRGDFTICFNRFQASKRQDFEKYVRSKFKIVISFFLNPLFSNLSVHLFRVKVKFSIKMIKLLKRIVTGNGFFSMRSMSDVTKPRAFLIKCDQAKFL